MLQPYNTVCWGLRVTESLGLWKILEVSSFSCFPGLEGLSPFLFFGEWYPNFSLGGLKADHGAVSNSLFFSCLLYQRQILDLFL